MKQSKKKARKLEARVKDYFITVANLDKGANKRSGGFKKPGSYSK